MDLSTQLDALMLAAEARDNLDRNIRESHEEVVARVADRIGDALQITKIISDPDAYRTGFILPENIRIMVDTVMTVKKDLAIFRTEARLKDETTEEAVVLDSKDLTVFWGSIPHNANRFNHSG